MINLKRSQPRVRVLGYYDEDDLAHIPEKQRCVVDYLISTGEAVPCEYLEYNKGKLTSVQILDPRRERGYIPVILYAGDFKMEVTVE